MSKWLQVPSMHEFGGAEKLLPGVRVLDTGRPGPNVVINAMMHGNEFAGGHALARLMRFGPQPECGRLAFTLANLAALAAFDPATPFASRFVDVDMNRVWGEVAGGKGDGYLEQRRASELWPQFRRADFLLDLHTMRHGGPALSLCGITGKARRFALAMGYPAYVVVDEGHSAGKRLIDIPPFAAEDSDQIALLVEAGAHDDPQSIDRAYQACCHFLHCSGMISRRPPSMTRPPRTIEITQTITVRHEPFALARPFKAFSIIEDEGTIIAMDGNIAIRTPHDQCVLIMPAAQATKGQTGLRLGRFLADDAALAGKNRAI